MNKRSQIKLKLLPLSSSDFEFVNDDTELDDNQSDELMKQLGINQVATRIDKIAQSTGIQGTSQEALLTDKKDKLVNFIENSVFPVFKSTVDSLLNSGFSKAQALNRARTIAFNMVKSQLNNVYNITDIDLFPRSALQTRLKDPSTINELQRMMSF
jgi:hypothetical protein